jgi:hypothetical protein
LNVPDDGIISVPLLREFLGLPPQRPDDVRDLLLIPRPGGAPLAGPWRLALGDWPETWRGAPGTGPRYLTVLHGLEAPYFIAAIWGIDQSGWGQDTPADPQLRAVPVISPPDPATSHLAGCRLDTDLRFGWPLPEEQYAFM